MLGYYDGPTDGIAECAGCSADFKFEIIDEDPDWEEGNDVRVYWLTTLPAGALSQILVVCPDPAEARWPIWCPIWRFASDAAQQAADAEVERVLSQAGPPAYVVASADGFQTLLSCEPAPSSKSCGDRDWFTYLGLSKRGKSHGA